MAHGNNIGEIGLLMHEAFSADGGLRRLLEAVLNQGRREESASHVGAEKHERSEGRRGYRNGTRPRSFKTTYFAISCGVTTGAELTAIVQPSSPTCTFVNWRVLQFCLACLPLAFLP